MGKIKYKPYGIDLNYEMKTYKNVGCDYGNAQSADLGRLFNLKRFWRKRKNREQTEYRFCDTYSDWEKHVQAVLPNNICNYADMLHWLEGKRNNAKTQLEMTKSILIPIYIALLTIYEIFLKPYTDVLMKRIFVLIAIIMVIIIAVSVLTNDIKTINFYDDFIKIAKKEK